MRRQSAGRTERWVCLALSSWVLILGWWLWHPLALFAFSLVTGNSVYVDRYLSLALPGAALTATLAAACFAGRARLANLLGRAGDVRTRRARPVAWKAIRGPFIIIPTGAARHAPSLMHGRWMPKRPCCFPALSSRPNRRCGVPIIRFQDSSTAICRFTKFPAGPILLPFERSPEGEQYAAGLVPTLSGVLPLLDLWRRQERIRMAKLLCLAAGAARLGQSPAPFFRRRRCRDLSKTRRLRDR